MLIENGFSTKIDLGNFNCNATKSRYTNSLKIKYFSKDNFFNSLIILIGKTRIFFLEK